MSKKIDLVCIIMVLISNSLIVWMTWVPFLILTTANNYVLFLVLRGKP